MDNSNAPLQLNGEDPISARQIINGILEAAADAIITIDGKGVIQSFNPAAEKMFGYGGEEAIGQNVKRLMPSPYAEEHDAYLEKYLETGQKKVIGIGREVVGLKKDGSEFPLELAVSEVRQGEHRLFTGILRDISDRKRAEREIAQLNQELIETSRKVGMSEVATGVLHNIGNVLNSINISVDQLKANVNNSQLPRLAKLTKMLHKHADDLGTFLTQDEKGKSVPKFLSLLTEQLTSEQDAANRELAELGQSIEHVKAIVSDQQSLGHAGGLEQQVDLVGLVEDAIKIRLSEFVQCGAELIREYGEDVPCVLTDRHKVLQIFVNLLGNAVQAVTESDTTNKRISVRVLHGADSVAVEVQDNGIGIAPENLTKIFHHGFTTKVDGHGFGLHSCALAAKTLGGSLVGESDGPGAGATFRLAIPIK